MFSACCPFKKAVFALHYRILSYLLVAIVRRAHIGSYRITDKKVLNSQFPLSGKSLLPFLYASERDVSRSATVVNLTHAYVSLTSTLFLHLKPHRKRTFWD